MEQFLHRIKSQRIILLGICMLGILLLVACSKKAEEPKAEESSRVELQVETKEESKEESKEETMGYTQITMADAWELFKTEGDYVIVDVRRADEFADGHIPGAILIPNETIQDTPPAELPDKDQLIYIYCRSGNRSKQASAKLVAMGYINIVEFGGIMNWPGAIEK